MMNIGVIDIGTNTVLLLVARFDMHGAITPLVYEQRIPRLGRGTDASGKLSASAMHRVIAVLEEYKAMIGRHDTAVTVVCGTSAVRDAANREEFTSMVHRATGFTLEILSGHDEALWTYRGAISGVPGTGRSTVIDIGGGSTEITCGDSVVPSQTVSLDIGSVRLSERCFSHDPPAGVEIEAASKIIKEEFSRARSISLTGSKLIGVAGTATSLAMLAQNIREFRIDAVSNYRMSRAAVEQLLRELASMDSDSIRKLSPVMEGRHDVITAGALILLSFMKHFDFNELIVSERGVRYGLAIREWEKRGGGRKEG